jgi:hypothetical protein
MLPLRCQALSCQFEECQRLHTLVRSWGRKFCFDRWRRGLHFEREPGSGEEGRGTTGHDNRRYQWADDPSLIGFRGHLATPALQDLQRSRFDHDVPDLLSTALPDPIVPGTIGGAATTGTATGIAPETPLLALP